MRKPIYVVDIIGEVVESTAKKLGDALHYQFGSYKEIANTMETREHNQRLKYKRYPLVALFQDFAEIREAEGGIYGKVSLNLIIATSSSSNDKSEQRYINTFKPILYPIYYELIRQIEGSNHFQSTGYKGVKHTKIDRPYWGNDWKNANKFPDYLDAIEINGLELTLNNNSC